MADPVLPANFQTPKAWRIAAFLLVAFDTFGLYLYMGRRDYLLNPVWIYISLYVTLFGLYVYAAGRLVPRLPKSCNRWLVPVILLFGIAFRAAVLPAPPSLSTDIYRYVWDGRLTVHGINPYRWAPNSQTLRSLRDPIWQKMEYKSYQTIYMPISQAFFALENAAFGNNLTAYKALYACFDGGVMLLGLFLLQSLGRSPRQIIWYAWCPLPITEIALAGHQDVIGVFFLLLTFVLAARPRLIAWAAVALVASILTKGFALLLLPLFIRTYGRRFAVVVGLTLLYLGMPLWVYLPEFLHGMQQYLDNVHVNGGLFHGVDQVLLPLTRYHYSIAQKLSDVAMLAAALWAGRRPAVSLADLVRRSFIVLAVTLLVVPTLFPWYLLWLLPLAAVVGRRPSWAFILLTGLVVFLYTYYISIQAYWWTPLAEYGPFYIALAWEYRLWRRTQGPPEPLCALPAWARFLRRQETPAEIAPKQSAA